MSEEEEEALNRRRPWSQHEVDLTVADYFAMLRAELAGDEYSKAGHNRDLRSKLSSRSKGSVEYKHQNISAVLVEMGLPYIEGYQPARNYQRTLLPQSVADYLAGHPGLLDELAEGPILNPIVSPDVAGRPFDTIFEEPPERIIIPASDERPWLSRRGQRIDFARRDAENRRLGLLGEQLTVEVERRRLVTCGRDDLAAKVEWLARTCGDGLGFDVLSFDEADDSEWLIEVKTTGQGKHFPFYVTATEVHCSEDCPSQFRLYRVFDFARNPRIFVVRGSLTQGCRLEPVVYRALLATE
jgi:hypothetical protein